MKVSSTLSGFSTDVSTTLHSTLFRDKCFTFKQLQNVECLHPYIHPTFTLHKNVEVPTIKK